MFVDFRKFKMINEEKYNQEIEQLFKQFPSYQQVGSIAYKEGLETMSEFDSLLGHPHRKFPVIHIAGTNGKGSVSHMLASVFMKLGLKTALYTSPHLLDFRERIKVDGKMISKEDVYEFLITHKGFMNRIKPSFFEITTALAFDYFAKQKVDIAVIETGLGGRLDSTNIVHPWLSIITNIGLDHCEQLGSTITAIALEKGGIIKENVPVVIGEHNATTKDIFEKFAAERGSKILFSKLYRFKEIKLSDYELDLKGDYQVNNLRTVLTALYVLSQNQSFLSLVGKGWSDLNIKEGLKTAAASTGLRGRWETLNVNPLVICDTGHNVHGLSVVFSQLRKQTFLRLFSIIGFVADKDIEKIMGLLPVSSYFYFTQANIPRALDAKLLAKRCKSVGLQGEVALSVEEAILKFRSVCKEGDLLFIGGSTFIVAEAIEFFEKNENFFAK